MVHASRDHHVQQHLGLNLMSATFLLAAAARRLAVTTAPFQPAACDPRAAAYAESACTAAAAALAEGRRGWC